MKKLVYKLSITFVAICICSSLIHNPLNSIENNDLQLSSSSPPPKGIRLNVIDDPRNSIAVTWYTESKTDSPKVYYATNPDLVGPSEKVAIERLIDGTYIYTAELTGLAINTTFFYKVMTDIITYNFTTAADRDMENVQFIVLGDTQSGDNVTWELTKKAMAKFGNDTDFLIHMGDVVSDGGKQEQYNEYFDNMKHILALKPCYYTEGNHENGLITKMYDNIPLPSNGMNSRYYSFTWGPSSFLSLNDVGAEFWPHTKMPLIWLDTELANFNKYKYNLWNFAYTHEALYNSKKSRADKHELIPTWGSLFDQHGVDIVFSGHNHYYERTYPINHLRQINKSETTNFIDPESPIYITNNADRKLYDYHDDDENFKLADYVYYNNKTRQVTYVNISIDISGKTTTLTLESWAIPTLTTGYYGDLVLIDTFTITKALPDKYTNPTYTTPVLVSHTRMPEFVYFILYFATLGLFIVILDRPGLKRYIQYKKPRMRALKKEIGSDKSTRIRSILSFIIFIVLCVVLAILFDDFGITSEEILNYGIGILAAFIIMIPINYILEGKNKAQNVISHMGFFLGLVLIIALIYLFNNVFYYMYYYNFILIGVGAASTYGANYYSKNIKESRLSHKDSFYLGGVFMLFGVFLCWYGAMNLIALF
jgi:predicted phosphodiesterase